MRARGLFFGLCHSALAGVDRSGRGCNPRSARGANRRFARRIPKRRLGTTERIFPTCPAGQSVGSPYDDEVYEGVIEGKRLVLPGMCSAKSFSRASYLITGKQRNGWLDWEILKPGEEHGILADYWRKGRE